MKRATLVLVALALLLAGAGRAIADYIPFSGSGTSGTISTPPGTEPWSVQYAPITPSPVDSWGIPGFDQGTVSWNGSGTESEFTVTFTNLPAGITIATVPTTFQISSLGVSWTPSFSSGDLTVTFTAPTGDSLTPGAHFFVNVFFTGNVGANGVAFTGAFDPQDAPPAVPEPSTLTLLGIGAASLVGYGLRRRRHHA